MKKVTDKALLDDLNRTHAIREQLLPPIKPIEDPGALATFGRSAFNAVPEALGNLMMKMGLSNPEVMQEALYGKGPEGVQRRERHEQGMMAHPIADLAGGAVGFAPLGGLTSAGLRAIPAVGRAVKAASPSLLKRTAVHGLEGGAIGSMYSPPGQEGEGFGLGALIGGALGGPGIGAARAFPGARQAGRNIANIEELGAQRETARNQYLTQEDLINKLKQQYAEQGTGLNTPEGITRQINNRMNQMQELQPQTQIPHEQVENLLNYPGGEELIPHAQNERNMHLKEMEHYLRSGAAKDTTLDVEAANEIRSSIKQMKKHIQKNYYEPVEEYTKRNYVQLPRTADIKQIEEQLSKISNDPTFKNSPGFEKMKQHLMKQGSGHDLVPADDFVKQWKETKQAASKARRKGFQEGGEDQAYWQDQAANLKQIADQQLQILEHHLPKQYYEKLVDADKLWKEDIAPFYGNRIYEQVKKLGRIDVANIPKELRGTGMGQEKMLKLFLSNPKLTRLALGHSYAKNPEALLNAGPHEQPFIEKLPSLKGMLERLKGYNRSIEVAKAHHERMQANRARAEEGHKELVKQQAERQKAIAQTQKLEHEIRSLESKRNKLKEELHKGLISKKEFERLEAEYNNALKNKKSLIKKVAYASSAVLGAYGLGDVIKQIIGK